MGQSHSIETVPLFFVIMGLVKTKSLILFLSLLFCSIVSAEIDVSDISIRGDSTLMGMRIESSYFE